MTRREREVRSYATELLDDLGLSTPPIVPEWIASEVELSVEEKPLSPGVFGALWKKGNRFGIFVSDSCPTAGHRRFSVAHELGHYHIDGHVEAMFLGEVEVVESSGGLFRKRHDRYEREADWFASELLVPANPFVSRIRSERAGIELVRGLAREFETSLSMTAIRYAELTDRAAAAILSRDGQIEWVALSTRIREHDWSWGLQKRDMIPPQTATWSVIRARTGFRRIPSASDSRLVCEWFEGAPPALELEEDAIALGRFGRVLTSLVIPGLPDPEELAMQSGDEEDADWRSALRGYRMD